MTKKTGEWRHYAHEHGVGCPQAGIVLHDSLTHCVSVPSRLRYMSLEGSFCDRFMAPTNPQSVTSARPSATVLRELAVAVY